MNASPYASRPAQQLPRTLVLTKHGSLVRWAWPAQQLSRKLDSVTLCGSVLTKHGLGAIDFRASNDKAVLYVSEADLVAGPSYRRRLAKFRKDCQKQQGIVIVENTPMTSQLFPSFQKFVVIDLNLSIIPVRNIEEAAKLLTQMVNCEGKVGANPFLKRDKKANSPDLSMLNAVLKIPGLGQKRALQIMDHYGSIFALAKASEDDLAKIVGKATGIAVYSFFNKASH
ncbi:unnamed protein product, partial [Meganyctiphanes norvegica]